MKIRRLKPFVIPFISAVMMSFLIICLITINKQPEEDNFDDNYNYVSKAIVEETVPVISEEDDIIIRPYKTDNINIYKKFYDGNENKENAIIYYNGTYIQNSGIIYTSDSEFDVVAVMDGEVIDVKKDDILGYSIDIKHSNDIITSYHGMKNIYVNKGDKLSKEALLGKSGEITLDVNLKNALLFEITKSGKYENPESYFDKHAKEM